MSKHSNVFYVCNKVGCQYEFRPVEKATGYKNDYGLDLFRYKGAIYEGRTGRKLITEDNLPQFADKIQQMGGIGPLNKLIESHMAVTGESPRYTRPDERKHDIFPPRQKDPNIVFTKDAYGDKHYYVRFHNDNGIELYFMQKDKSSNRTVYVMCEGHMLGIGSHLNLDRHLVWLAGLENGIRAEVEKRFNESMANPERWADLGLANILGRTDEAKAHNAPIRKARELKNQQEKAEREAARIAEEKAMQAEYEQAIELAVRKLLRKEEVVNSTVLGDKSLIMQLFREHEITVPLKTQGWIINSMVSVYYNVNSECWSYYYSGNKSTVFLDYLNKLIAVIETKFPYGNMG